MPSLLALMLLSALAAGCARTRVGSEPAAVPAPVGPEAMLAQMFPGRTFAPADGTAAAHSGRRFKDDLGRTFVIESQTRSSFTAAKAFEMLLLVSRTSNETSHTSGLYNAWAAVFDGDGRQLISNVLPLAADEPHLAFFEGKGRTYLFFAGPSIFQGWAEWQGGLWAADPAWHQVWPEDPGFWGTRAVSVLCEGPASGSFLRGNGLQVMERRILPNPEQRVVPPHEYVPTYRLPWDPVEARFVPN